MAPRANTSAGFSLSLSFMGFLICVKGGFPSKLFHCSVCKISLLVFQLWKKGDCFPISSTDGKSDAIRQECATLPFPQIPSTKDLHANLWDFPPQVMEKWRIGGFSCTIAIIIIFFLHCSLLCAYRHIP